MAVGSVALPLCGQAFARSRPGGAGSGREPASVVAKQTPLINAFLLALLPAQQSGASLIHARMLAALANLDQGEFTEGGVACTSNLVPKSATSDGDKAKGPALPVAVFGEIPWQ
jgi:hypothetical protein